MKRPRDGVDLALAPVALAVDQRLEQLGRLDRWALRDRLRRDANRVPRSRDEAARAVLAAATRDIDTHGWEASWDERGIRLRHGDRLLVLGVPGNLAEFVATVGGRRLHRLAGEQAVLRQLRPPLRARHTSP